MICLLFFFKQKTAYEMRISDWSSDVCSSDLPCVLTQELGERDHLGQGCKPRRPRVSWPPVDHIDILLEPARFNECFRVCETILFWNTASALPCDIVCHALDEVLMAHSVRVRDRKSTRLNSSP